MSFFPRAIKSRQVGTITLASVASNTDTLGTAVDPNYAIVRLMGVAGTDSNPLAALARVRITGGGTTVTAYAGGPLASTEVVGYEVLEFYRFFLNRVVQEGVISMADGGGLTNTASVTAATGTYELLWSGSNAGATVTNSNATGGVIARLSVSGTTITATRASSSNDGDTGWAYLDWR